MTPIHRLFAVRGAVCCENTKKSISELVPGLYREIIEKNSIPEPDIVSVLFSVTGDLTVLNPATALRNAGMAASVPLFCTAEPEIEGALPGVIRILLTCYAEIQPDHIYMNGAEILRPDIPKK
ncbi:chorismate mutase [Brucepastera parasyntrophica]|uniref:chorismate mutase n=1 Tax=Brucepastera parasyntrophica TaxID=2880008 RepID=UPI00210C15FD|nr:chorismate mutase [Brucepastera parasyntrophica]ULQ59979.1 chorismate mutase [Brucepastera parasyntrophica]